MNHDLFHWSHFIHRAVELLTAAIEVVSSDCGVFQYTFKSELFVSLKFLHYKQTTVLLYAQLFLDLQLLLPRDHNPPYHLL
jgi:hypothetical protein